MKNKIPSQNKHLFRFLRIGYGLGHSVNTYETCTEPRINLRWKLRPSQVFSEHAPSPGHVHGFLNFPVSMGVFICPNFPKNLSFSAQALSGILSQTYLLCKHLWVFTSLHSVFQQCPLLFQTEFQVWKNWD